MVECPGTDCANDQTDDETNYCVDDDQHDGLQKTDAETLDDSNPEGKSDHCGYPLKESANGTENGKNTSKNKCGGRLYRSYNSHFTYIYSWVFGFQFFGKAGKQSDRTGFA